MAAPADAPDDRANPRAENGARENAGFEPHGQDAPPAPTESGALQLRRWAQIQIPPATPLVLQVSDVFRYPVDAPFFTVSGLDPAEYTDLKHAYDAVLSDGVDKVKVLLHPSLNPRVEKGELAKLVVVRVTDVEKRYDDTKPKVPHFEILKGFERIGELEDVFQREERKPSYPTGTPLSARIRAPLIGKRRFYLAPTTTDIPLAFAKRDDIPTRISLELVLPDSEDGEPHPGIPTDHPSIAELVALRIGKRPRGLGNVQSDPPPRGDGPPILGRITSKFPFLGYPKPSDTNDPFPCLFQLTLSDSTYNGPHSIKVNVWNKNAVEMWWVLQIGDVVWVEDYKARSVRGGGVEVMVNPGRYGSFLRIVKPELHLKSWPKGLIDARLPLPPLRLASAARLGLLPDSSEIEHAGLLIHVGNVELERSPSGDREYRWVVVNDTTGLVPIKLYVSAGPTMVKQRLVPGYHVFATHLAVSTASHLGQKRRVYLRGTPETQVTVFDPEDSEGLWFAEGVKGLCVPAENRLKEYTVSGHIDPVLPHPTLSSLIRTQPRRELVPFGELKGIVDGLAGGERKRVWVVCAVSGVVVPGKEGVRRVELVNGGELEGGERGVKRKEVEEVEEGEGEEEVPETPKKRAKVATNQTGKGSETPATIFSRILSIFGGKGGEGDLEGAERAEEEAVEEEKEPEEVQQVKEEVQVEPRLSEPLQPPQIIGAFTDSRYSLLRSFPHFVEAPTLPSESGEKLSASERELELSDELLDASADPVRPDPVAELVKEAVPEDDWKPAWLDLEPINPGAVKLRALVLPNCAWQLDSDSVLNVPSMVRRAFITHLAPCLTAPIQKALESGDDDIFESLLKSHWNDRRFLIALNLHRDGWRPNDVKCVVSEGYLLPDSDADADDEEMKLTVREGENAWVVGSAGEEKVRAEAADEDVEWD